MTNEITIIVNEKEKQLLKDALRLLLGIFAPDGEGMYLVTLREMVSKSVAEEYTFDDFKMLTNKLGETK